ncbi:MAG: SGNH hydrolase domain-containing protein [Janthinobacterium lividum]
MKIGCSYCNYIIVCFHRQLVAEIKRRVPSLMIYDLTNFLCDSNRYYVARNYIAYYVDDNHLSFAGSELINNDPQIWLKNNME